MKKYLLVLCALALATGCTRSDSDKVNKEDLKTYFSHKLRDYDTTMRLEAFTFVKLDTISEKEQLKALWSGILRERRHNMSMVELYAEKVKLNAQMHRLSRDLSENLAENYKDEVNDAAEKVKELVARDSLLDFDMTKVDSLMRNADSTAPVALWAVCAYTLKKEDQSVSKDTARIILDLDYNILSDKEFLKRLNKVYTPVSDFKFGKQ